MKNFIALCSWLALLVVILIAARLKGQDLNESFWTYNGFADEFQYHIPSLQPATSLRSPYQVCGAVGEASDGFFYADIVRPHVEEKIQSVEFNTLDGAKAFVERQCR